MVTDLNTDSETIKLLEENRGETLQGISIGKDFFYDPKAQRTRAKIKKCNCIK